MGMYNDDRYTKREGWEYKYKGSVLFQYAERKRAISKTKETEARKDVAALMEDQSVRANDERVEKARQAVEDNANLYEKCVIWCHEFKRNPEQEYVLQLGDVSFFDIPEEFRK